LRPFNRKLWKYKVKQPQIRDRTVKKIKIMVKKWMILPNKFSNRENEKKKSPLFAVESKNKFPAG